MIISFGWRKNTAGAQRETQALAGILMKFYLRICRYFRFTLFVWVHCLCSGSGDWRRIVFFFCFFFNEGSVDPLCAFFARAKCHSYLISHISYLAVLCAKKNKDVTGIWSQIIGITRHDESSATPIILMLIPHVHYICSFCWLQTLIRLKSLKSVPNHKYQHWQR